MHFIAHSIAMYFGQNGGSGNFLNFFIALHNGLCAHIQDGQAVAINIDQRGL